MIQPGEGQTGVIWEKTLSNTESKMSCWVRRAGSDSVLMNGSGI